MSNTFIYSKGEIVEKATMDYPDLVDEYSPNDLMLNQDNIVEYNKHLASLRRYPYPYPCKEGAELVEAVDFEIHPIYSNGDRTYFACPLKPIYTPEQIKQFSDVWDAASDWQLEYDIAVQWGNSDSVDAPDKQQYFLKQFNHKI